MPRSSGTYSAPASSWNPAVNAASATLADWNALLADITAALTQSVAKDGQTTLTGNIPAGGYKLTGLGAGSATGDSARWEQLFDHATPASLASAATTNIGAQNSTAIEITGTTTITSFGTSYKGPRFLRFTGALILTHDATALNLPGGVNVTTAAGDTCIVIPNSTGNGWNVVAYQLATNSPGVATSATTVGAFRNLALSSNGTNANINISADEIVVENTSNSYKTLRSVSRTVSGATSGAVDALDTGSLATGTWYSVWVICKDDGTQGGLISLSATAPTMPSGYTYKARVGWIKTDGSGNKYPLAFKQYGRKVRYVVAGNVTGIPTIAGGATAGNPTTPTYVSAQVQSNSSTTGIIPSTAPIACLNLHEMGGSSQSIVAPTNSYGAYNSTTNPPPMIGGVASVATSVVSVNYDMILESVNVYYALGSNASYLYLTGWEDNI